MRIKLSEFIETLEEERDILQAKVSAINAVIEAYGGTGEPSEPKKSKTPKRKAGFAKGVRRYTLCHKPGHRSPTCPRGESLKNIVSDAEEEGDDERTEEQLKAAIQGLKKDGYDSLQVAARLKVRLSKVNEHWTA